ncbi:preprotein translocase subunit SecE [Corynebacterium yudongzhengii]|uniref:Protein translocase subunit SecE n=1 Tax=Corynebacterium yudongzhengii TaxID=2080740 RepID=A0A2U1T9P6_9CORY|nr:preprotein translocase subunit SecE [Corynebacterium yudongzhengii]AWB81192.1 preprotein translocase subunit SecE [Corynebacterium yudongzhengii]PWC02731.1 preprotein translocase subunit SecE [Corynebacterium yudongzhengii]
MTDGTQKPDSARPTGKRQLSGASTISTASVEAKRAQQRREEDSSEGPGGGVVSFLPEVVQEVRKVVWPTGREMVTYTLVVFAFLIFLTALVWGVDQLVTLGVDAVLT